MPAKPFKLSVKVLIENSAGDCLLLRRSAASKNNAGKWDMPGGKVDPGEDFSEALLREVAEETGLAIRLEQVVGAAESELPNHKVAYLFFSGRVISGEVSLSGEHDSFDWVERERLGRVDACPQFQQILKIYASG